MIRDNKIKIILLGCFGDCLTALFGSWALYANMLSPIYFHLLMVVLVLSLFGRLIEEIYFFNYFLQNKPDDQPSQQDELSLANDGPNQKFYLFVYSACVISTISRFFSKYAPALSIFLACQILSIGWATTLASLFGICEMVKILINSTVAIEAQLNHSSTEFVWKLSDKCLNKLKHINFYCCSLIAVYEGTFAIIGLWIPHFILPLPVWMIVVCGLSYTICNLLMQVSFNKLSDKKDPITPYNQNLKQLLVVFMSCAWLGKLISKLCLFYFFHHVFLATIPLSSSLAYYLACISTIFSTMISAKIEFIKLYQTYHVLDSTYFKSQYTDVCNPKLIMCNPNEPDPSCDQPSKVISLK